MNSYAATPTRRTTATSALLLALVLVLAAWGLPRLSAEAAPVPTAPAVIVSHAHGVQEGAAARLTKPSQAAFHDEMRMLWEDHVTWTRLAIVTFADESPSFPATAERLLQNQVAIGDAIKPYYGEEAGNQLTALLQEHITIAVEIMQAARAGDTVALADARARWSANGDDIGTFLGTADPRNWPADQMRAGMATHLAQTFDEAAHELGGDYAASIASYDEARLHMLGMADLLSDGIIARFPARFR